MIFTKTYNAAAFAAMRNKPLGGARNNNASNNFQNNSNNGGNKDIPAGYIRVPNGNGKVTKIL